MSQQSANDDFQTPSKFKKKKSPARKLLTIPPSPFLEKLGYGTGVNVWKLTHSPKMNFASSPWAIKNIKSKISGPLSDKYESLLKNEANILKTLSHENIIGFRGYLESDDGRNCLAMEIGGESLGNLIEERAEMKLGPYPPEIIVKVALDVSKALKYLHEKKKILHGDLKPQNIVIKNNFEEIKLCDFGVSLSLTDDKLSEKYIGTPIYSAPECFKNSKEQITEKADIFSFGLILFEMISLTPPHVQDLINMDDESFTNSDMDESLLDFSHLTDISEDDIEEIFGTRPLLPSDNLGCEYNEVIEIFYACTEHDQNKRPSARLLVNYLQKITQKQ